MRTFSPCQLTAIMCVTLRTAHTHAFVHVLPLQSLAPRTTSMSPSILSMDTLNNHELNMESLVNEAASASALAESAAVLGVLDNGVSQLIDEDEEDDVQTEMDRKHMNLAIQTATSRYVSISFSCDHYVRCDASCIMSILARTERTKCTQLTRSTTSFFYYGPLLLLL